MLRHLNLQEAQSSLANVHMKFSRQLVVLPVLALLFGVGCQKKSSQLPTQAKAPAEVIPSTLPVEISEEAPPPPPPEESEPQPPPPEETKPKSSAHRRHKAAQPPVTTQSGATAPPAGASNGTTTIAAAHPPANPAAATAIAADVSSAQLSQQKQTTAQLLDETEKTVSGLNRTLSKDDEAIVVQIRSYVVQSRSATKDGDFERAYNLANKAHLLSAALIKK